MEHLRPFLRQRRDWASASAMRRTRSLLREQVTSVSAVLVLVFADCYMLGLTRASSMSIAAEVFLSPQIASVNNCGAGDIAAEFPSRGAWIDMLVLRVTFHGTPPDDRVPFALQLVRSVETAIDEYGAAREHLNAFLGKGRETSAYFRALNHFELAVYQLCRPREHYVRHPAKSAIPEDPVLHRLQGMCDTSKHQPALRDQTIWITNSGLASRKGEVTFVEIEGSLRSLADLAIQIVTPSQGP